MTDFKIYDSDVACDSSGRFIKISGQEAMIQRAWICCCAVLGSFIYDRSIGSDLKAVDLESCAARDRLQLVINEAVARYANTQVEVLEIGEKAKLKITVDGKSEVREANLYGNI